MASRQANHEAHTDLRLDRIEGEVASQRSPVEMRFDRVDRDIAELKADVSGLQQGLAETRDQLNRFEHATERRFNRIDTQFERLFGAHQAERDEAVSRP